MHLAQKKKKKWMAQRWNREDPFNGVYAVTLDVTKQNFDHKRNSLIKISVAHGESHTRIKK